MKKYLLLFLLSFALKIHVSGQISGTVLSADQSARLADVQVLNDVGITLTRTSNDGTFYLEKFNGNFLVFSLAGFKSDTVSQPVSPLLVMLEPLSFQLHEVVVSTGYQSFSQRKSTGSAAVVDQELINRTVSIDILSRLEGVTSSLSFIRTNSVNENAGAPELRIRGKNTLFGDGSPLIILDNFPFEGDINSINPNDVESVSVLKDASASAIWGARAGNGVLVITTKKSKLNQPLTVSFTANLTSQSRPDLHYSPSYISASDFIDIERELYSRGYYALTDWTVLSPVVENLIAGNEETISSLRNIDYRKEAARLFYQNSLNRQYFVNLRGGGNKYSFYLSGGYDDNEEIIRRNTNERYTLQSSFSFQPGRLLDISFGNTYTLGSANPNGTGITSIYPSNKAALLPYTRFTDAEGWPEATVRDFRTVYVNNAENTGLLNWQYKPLQELYLNNVEEKNLENRTTAGLTYKPLPSLRFEVKYLFHTVLKNNVNHRDSDSYHVRNLINRYTQPDGSLIIPKGNIVEQRSSEITNRAFRSQVNYELDYHSHHYLQAMAGGEISHTVTRAQPGYVMYGVDPDIMVGINRLNYAATYPLRPMGSGTIPTASSTINELDKRSVSFFGNALYMYKERYSVSVSMRNDGANIYGVKTNQRFTPLWSAGGAWILSEEKFWKSRDYLKLRFTYGYSGNSLTNATAYTTALYSTDISTGLRNAVLRSPGNPSLSWEKIQTINWGADFSWFSKRINGSIDYFLKRGLDLIGDNVMDPTTGLGFSSSGGILNSRTNYAGTKTRGLDIDITSINTVGKLKWSTSWLANFVTSRVKNYAGVMDPNVFNYTARTGSALPVEGAYVDALFSLPWYGLSSENGYPLVRNGEVLNQDYGLFVTGKSPDDLILSGSLVPQISGSIRNTLQFKGLTLSANVTWKARYFFRADGINYYSLFTSWGGNEEFSRRWRKPGDERITQVPAMPSKEDFNSSSRRDMVYINSEALIEKGDHIRLNDIAISYTLTPTVLPVKSVRITFLVQNPGILWRANSRGIDPDYPYASYPPSLSYSFGLNLNF